MGNQADIDVRQSQFERAHRQAVADRLAQRAAGNPAHPDPFTVIQRSRCQGKSAIKNLMDQMQGRPVGTEVSLTAPSGIYGSVEIPPLKTTMVDPGIEAAMNGHNDRLREKMIKALSTSLYSNPAHPEVFGTVDPAKGSDSTVYFVSTPCGDESGSFWRAVLDGREVATEESASEWGSLCASITPEMACHVPEMPPPDLSDTFLRDWMAMMDADIAEREANAKALHYPGTWPPPFLGFPKA